MHRNQMSKAGAATAFQHDHGGKQGDQSDQDQNRREDHNWNSGSAGAASPCPSRLIASAARWSGGWHVMHRQPRGSCRSAHHRVPWPGTTRLAAAGCRPTRTADAPMLPAGHSFVRIYAGPAE
jgi:hypothetical protein